MKASIYSIAALALMSSLAACSDDAELQSAVETIVSFDGEAEFLSNFFVLNDLGQVEQNIIGQPLDAKDPSVVSYAMGDIDAARDHFLSLIPEDGLVEKKPDGSIVYTPVKIETSYLWDDDSEDEPKEVNSMTTEQPTVVFAPVEKGNLLATITFNTANSPVKRADVLYDWPLNSDSPYQKGELVWAPTFQIMGAQTQYVCVREAKDGVSGILIAISKDPVAVTSPFPTKDKPGRGMLYSGNKRDMPNENEMRDCWAIFKADMDRWTERFHAAGGGELKFGENYWFGKTVLWDWCTFRGYKDKDQRECFSRFKNWKYRCWQIAYFAFK